MPQPKQFKGPRGARGPRPKVENPGKLLKRLLGYVFKSYTPHCIIVFICILISVLANAQGTMFLQDLIDVYIMPMIGTSDPDFKPLATAILKVASFYLCGAAASYIYGRILVVVSQGTLKSLRNDMFSHMEKLPIKYFDTNSHGDIMSVYTNDIDTLRQMISQSIPQLINSTFTIITVFVCMVKLNIPLTVLTIVMVAVMLGCTKKFAGLSGKYFTAQQRDLGKVNGFIEEMMSG